MKKNRRNQILLYVVAGLMFLSSFAATSYALGRPLLGGKLHGFVLESPQPLPNFTLNTHTGEEMSLYDFRGKVTLVYFGYAFCPDICPTTLADLKAAKEMLWDHHQDDVQVLMVTVDPERATPELLETYLGYFDPSFIGLSGTPEQIATAAAPLGIYYEKREVGGATGYLYDHTASVAVIDKKGRLRLVYPYNTPAEDIAADLWTLVRE